MRQANGAMCTVSRRPGDGLNGARRSCPPTYASASAVARNPIAMTHVVGLLPATAIAISRPAANASRTTGVNRAACGVVSNDKVQAELADLAADRKLARLSEDELVIFGSSGGGVQDVAAAWVCVSLGSSNWPLRRLDLLGAAMEQ